MNHHAPAGSDLASSLTSNNTDGLVAGPGLAAPFDPAAYFAAHTRTMEHGAAVLAARRAPRRVSELLSSERGERGTPSTAALLPLPPVWTPHRAYLSEALDYVGDAAARGMQGETLAEGGGVMSLVLGGGDGSRGYLDGEVLVCEVGGGLGVWEAWERTLVRCGSVVVVVGREWAGAEGVVPWPEGIGERGCVVLDNFRVCELWEEVRGGVQGVVAMVKLQKAVLSEVSWWMVGKEGGESVLDLNERRFLGDEWHESKRLRCPACDKGIPRVYRECWICMNSSCGQFWRGGLIKDGEGGPLRSIPIPNKLRWDKTFLMARTMFDPDMRPTWDLQPDITVAFTPPWEPVQGSNVCATGTIRMRSLWRGGVCSTCKTIVPAVEWCVWKCVNPRCQAPWRLRVDIGPMPLRAAVPRMFASWMGHPMLEPEWADGLGGDVTRVYRPTYMVDSWNFNGGEWPIKLKIITPTAQLNQKPGGADSIWASLLSETRSPHGNGPPNRHPSLPPRLVLNRSNQYPKLDKYFHKTFGVDYGFDCSEGDSHTKALPMSRASASVSQARDVLDAISRDELAGFFIDTPNSVQVHGYMQGMSLGWHVGGEQDLGNTVATMSLGADAELLIRPRTDQDAGPWTSCVVADKEDLFRALTRVPLIHGSIVIIHGPFHDYFEHKVDCKGPLRFAVTTRQVKQLEKEELLRVMDVNKISQRFNGPWFMDSDREEEPIPTRNVMASIRQPSFRGQSSYGIQPFFPRHSSTGRYPPLKRSRPRDRSPSPRPRQRRRVGTNEPDDDDGNAYKTPGWTLAQKDQIYEWKKTHTYKQVAKLFEDKYGEGKVKHGQLRMVVHRVRKDRQKAAALRGEVYEEEDDGVEQDEDSSIAPSDSASAVANGYVDPSKWTQTELDLLVACRALDPPLAYKDISAKMQTDLHRVRSDKACREQMTTLNRKKKGLARARAPGAAGPGNGGGQGGRSTMSETGGGTPAPEQREATSPLALHPMNADADGDMIEVEDEDEYDTLPVLPVLQQQVGWPAGRARHSSRVGQTQSGTPAAVVAASESRGSRGASRGSRLGSTNARGGGDLLNGVARTSGVEETPSIAMRIRTRSRGYVPDDSGL